MQSKVLLAICFLSLPIGLALSSEACGQRNSIWHRRSTQMTNLAGSNRAANRGDLLSITITEKSAIANKDLRKLKKQNSSGSDANAGVSLTGGAGNSAGNMAFDQASSGNREFTGDAQFNSAREYKDQFTVKIVDRLPNGNLIVSGSRSVSLEGDNRRLILTGVIRAFDVTNDNTIPSQMVSELTLRYESDPDEGVERVFINQGWLGKRLNRLWPH